MGVPRFWREIGNRYNLLGTHCKKCDQYYFPPRILCPTCRRDGVIEEHQFKGTGKVVTYTVVRSATDEFDRQVPYVLAVVELDEGVRLTSQIVCDPDEVHMDMRVKSVFRKIGEEGPKGMIYYGTKFVPDKGLPPF